MILVRSRPRIHRFPAVGLAFALIVAGVIASATTPPAKAYTLYYYCNILTPPHTACSSRPAFQSYDFNHAEYDGEGTVNVCEHTYGPDGNTVSDRCNDNVVGSSTDLEYYWVHGFSLTLTCGNNSIHTHTIFCWGQRG